MEERCYWLIEPAKSILFLIENLHPIYFLFMINSTKAHAELNSTSA